jgi:hypothetical protein
MSAQTENSDALEAVLVPELKKLCRNAPEYGEIILRASLHDGDVGKVSLGIETARKITSRSNREVTR